MSADLVSLVYVSNARAALGDPELQRILTGSRENNDRLGVTGMLLHRNGRFVQILEGPADTVHALVERIAADPRHADLRVLLDEPIDERQFTAWSMGFQPISTPQSELPEGFRDTFDDLDAAADRTHIMRAIREISLWFRVRSARPTPPPAAA
ncbi:BLUF domain-containing protein [Microbacterium xanthum]|uniref:BLUF domain-containing protein n=1 Tax=Microbacterium xanthum TaxID=3079794 RepID=UPI002AD2926E|nr:MULTISPECIES: BLUF domain-containing protein [unclassified Microbacterium]MDZ8170785.1 BLUF domain-containing protein [Microbacterium sp. KSW-48]MDZ8201294.1 BLUF domain-containing protein [Microbacterium sp. SSW1-59]